MKWRSQHTFRLIRKQSLDIFYIKEGMLPMKICKTQEQINRHPPLEGFTLTLIRDVVSDLFFNLIEVYSFIPYRKTGNPPNLKLPKFMSFFEGQNYLDIDWKQTAQAILAAHREEYSEPVRICIA
jgi:hypothetical protein